MHETDLNPTHPSSEPAEGLEASALRAHAWYGEPFLHAGEDPVAALAPGTARRAALDDAIAEMDAGRKTPSNRWRVRYGADARARARARLADRRDRLRHRAAPPPGRRARRACSTELIAANQRDADENGNGNGNGERARRRADAPSWTRRTTTSTRA